MRGRWDGCAYQIASILLELVRGNNEGNPGPGQAVGLFTNDIISRNTSRLRTARHLLTKRTSVQLNEFPRTNEQSLNKDHDCLCTLPPDK
jgi:hypothetical protein